MRFLIVLGAVFPLMAEDAASMLVRARAAYESNQAQEKNWNWTVIETRSVINKAGAVLQKFPSVTAESVIRDDGRRCNALLAWGDGQRPYRASADPDSRCQAMEVFRAPFSVIALLGSKSASVGAGGTLLVAPDKSRLKSRDPEVRCAASLKATVKVDAATGHPVLLEGTVVENGCDIQFPPVIQYGTRRPASATSNFRKGSTFRMEFELQPDRLGRPEHGFWICVAVRFVQPWDSGNPVLYYWGRQAPVTAGKPAHRLIKEVRTTAKQFGAESQLRFETVDK